MAELKDRYLGQLQSLLPQGLAWSKEPESWVSHYLEKLATWFTTLDSRAQALLREADPRLATEMLDDWEESLGLPDACTVGVQAVDDRRNAIVAKLTDQGGARVARFVALAKSLGYENTTVGRLRPFTCRVTCCEELWGEESRFAWRLNLNSGTSTDSMAANSLCSESIRRWGDAVLECVVTRETPAISDVIFNYGES